MSELTVGSILEAVQDCKGEIDNICIELQVLSEEINIHQLVWAGIEFDAEQKTLYLLLDNDE